MEKNKKLYPLKFIPVPSRRIWGGDSLIRELHKSFTECDEDGNETALTLHDNIGESWEIADMGIIDSVVSEGWLAGNTISEIMETYFERVVGEGVYQYYGRQFPLLVKFLDIRDRLSVQVHPDDETAEQRYDALGKKELWYVIDAAPDAVIYLGFNKDVTAQELYDRCNDGTVEEILNAVHPKKGDYLLINPGTVHSGGNGLVIAEIEESSDLTFRLYDWGREKDPDSNREIHLAEAMDFIDYSRFDESCYHKGPLWNSGKEEATGGKIDKMVEKAADCQEFIVSRIRLTDPLQMNSEQFGSFVIYVCIEGKASIQVHEKDEKGKPSIARYTVSKGETILLPAEIQDYFLVPEDRSTILLEATAGHIDMTDDYINPDTSPFLEGEDYEGLEDDYEEHECDCGHDHHDCGHDHHDCGCKDHHDCD